MWWIEGVGERRTGNIILLFWISQGLVLSLRAFVKHVPDLMAAGFRKQKNPLSQLTNWVRALLSLSGGLQEHTHTHTDHDSRNWLLYQTMIYKKKVIIFRNLLPVAVKIVSPTLESITTTSIIRVIVHQQWVIVYTEGPWGQILTAHSVSKSDQVPQHGRRRVPVRCLQWQESLVHDEQCGSVSHQLRRHQWTADLSLLKGKASINTTPRKSTGTQVEHVKGNLSSASELALLRQSSSIITGRFICILVQNCNKLQRYTRRQHFPQQQLRKEVSILSRALGLWFGAFGALSFPNNIPKQQPVQ